MRDFPRFDNFVQTREKLLKLLQIITKIFDPVGTRENSQRLLEKQWKARTGEKQGALTLSAHVYRGTGSRCRWVLRAVHIFIHPFPSPDSSPPLLAINKSRSRRENSKFQIRILLFSKNIIHSRREGGIRIRIIIIIILLLVREKKRIEISHSIPELELWSRVLFIEFNLSPPSSTRPVAFVREENSRKRKKKKKRRKPAIESVQFLSRFLKRDYFSSRRGKTGWKPVKVYLKEDERGKKNYRTAVHARTYI